MRFSDDQTKELKAPLSRDNVRSREQGNRDVFYVEGWHVIAEANRIFGFDNWSSETLDVKCVSEKERTVGKQQRPGWGVTYTARVRIMISGDGWHVVRDGCGSGHGIDVDVGQAHESALKEAETDARKRALMTFGNPFGLALYDKEQANVANEPDSRTRFLDATRAKIAELEGDALGRWWNSDEQKKARRDFDLDAGELMELKGLVTAKLQPRTNDG